MPRYLVERTFPSPWEPAPPGPSSQGAVAAAHERAGVTWHHSYLAADHLRSYCIVDGPSPEAIRMAAGAGGLPVDRITEVRVLDPRTTHRQEPS